MAKSLKQKFIERGTRNNRVYSASNPDPVKRVEEPGLIARGQKIVKDFIMPSRSIQDVMIERAMAGDMPEQYTKKEYRKGGKVKAKGVGCAQRGHGKGRMR